MLTRARSILLLLSMPGIAHSPQSFATPGPENRWEVDYGSTSCQLIRHFVSNGQAYRLEFQRDWSSGGHDWKLYGAALPAYSTPTTISIAWNASADVLRFKTNPYMFKMGEGGAVGWRDVGEHLFEKLHDDQQIRLTDTKKLDLVLTLPKLSEARQALETCEDDLLAGWDVDAKQWRLQSVGATPSGNPGRWVTNNDYPRADFFNKNEGTTIFLLAVGADGALTDCRVIGSSGFATLDAQTCILLRARATFHPAKDEAGKAVAGFYVNRVLWRVPG